MPDRLRVSTGTPWEAKVGYSRAIRVGNTVWTAGTTATDDSGRVVGPGDAYAQMRHCLRRIETALTQAGAPPVGPGLAAAVLIMAATPTMTIYATLAQRYGEEEMGAAGMMATTVASFFTLSGLLWLLDRAGMLS